MSGLPPGAVNQPKTVMALVNGLLPRRIMVFNSQRKTRR